MSLKNNKNILFFAQEIHEPWIEWVKNNAINICEWLKKKLNISIISHNSSDKFQKENVINGVHVHYYLRLEKNYFFQIYFFLIWALKSLCFVLNNKPDKIFVQYLDTSYLLCLALIKIFKPSLPIYITLYSTDEITIWYKKIFLKFFKFNKIIIISDYLRKYIVNLWYDAKNIFYIPLSYDKKRYLDYTSFEKRSKKTILFSAWPIKEAGSFLVVDLAKIMPDYTFIFAMRKFNEKSEEELRLLKNYISESKVDNIIIKRNIDKMEDLLSSVSWLVLPLQDINVKMLVPVALLEAMARWTNCFVSDLPNLIELVKDNHNAIVFKKDDINDLKEKILLLLQNETIANNAYSFAESYPSFDEIIEKYYKLILE